MPVWVKCKNEDCGSNVSAAAYAQVPEDKLEEVLHNKNYYLCQVCGKVHNYKKEDHFVE